MNDTTPIDVPIEELDWRARGVGHAHGSRHRIRGVLPGEVARITTGDSLRVHEVLNPSSLRRNVDCDQAQHCPGCQLRHAQDAFSMPWKIARVERDLRQAGMSPPAIEWLGQAPRDGYRVRAVAHALTGPNGEFRLGMRASDAPIDLASCPVQSPPCRALLSRVEQELSRLGVAPYDPLTRSGELRHVIIEGPVDVGSNPPTSDAEYERSRVTLCFGRPVSFEGFAASLVPQLEGATLLADILPFRSPGLLRQPTALHGSGAIDMRIGVDWFRATLPAWTPQTPATVLDVQAALLNSLDCGEDSRVLEVGCGVGTNSLAIARRVRTLVGIDSCRAAIDDAKFNAMRAAITNCEFRVGEAAGAVPRLLKSGHRFDEVVLHAMRRPFGPRAMGTIRYFQPSRIVYLGPSARSMAEDLFVLAGYRLARVGVIDQSPGTTGSLTIAVLKALTP